MPVQQYRFQVRNARGETVGGVLAAESVAGAAQVLRGRGDHILQLSPAAGGESAWKRLNESLSFSAGPSQKDILDFTTQLAVMIRAGISIRSALEGIAEQVANAKFKRILIQIKGDVESGKQFSEAIARHPKLFGPLYVSMVRASEMSGSFGRMLDRIANYLAQEAETRRMVVGASIYPGIIALMAIGTTVFLLTFVLPSFAGVFKGKEEALPAPTTFLLGLSKFMIEYWWLILLAVGGVAAGFLSFIRTEIGGLWWDGFKISAPVLKRMFRALYLSRSLQTMGELLNAGVPMLDTLAITGDVSGNRHYRRLWRSVHNSVKQGKQLQTQLARSPLLPRSVVQMVSAGEESGRLGEVLDEISGYYAKALRDAIKAVTGMIEPIMIVLMGSIVGFIAMAIILPIFKMSNLASGK
ncbi:MAG: type II secretion system F family protein [Phycisphaera sp.]|nr:type II secretion system F family protein [Phycisphaera sp.]